MAIKYKWLVEQLREIISDSIQKGINKLPTEQELAGRYRVSSGGAGSSGGREGNSPH